MLQLNEFFYDSELACETLMKIIYFFVQINILEGC